MSCDEVSAEVAGCEALDRHLSRIPRHAEIPSISNLHGRGRDGVLCSARSSRASDRGDVVVKDYKFVHFRVELVADARGGER